MAKTKIDMFFCPYCKFDLGDDLMREHERLLNPDIGDEHIEYIEYGIIVLICYSCLNNIKFTYDDDNDYWNKEMVDFKDPTQLNLFEPASQGNALGE